MRRMFVPAVGVAAGLGVAAVAVRRTLERPDDLYAWDGPRGVTLEAGSRRMNLPLTYHRSEQVISFHAAALEPVRAILPTEALHPVTLPDGRALLAVSAARYLEATAPDTDPRDLLYGEVMVAILVTREPAPPLVPLVRAMLPGRGAPAFGAFLLHVAMTDRSSRDGGRAFGFPAFVGDLAFEDDVHERRVALSEDGRDILRLRVASRGRASVDHRPMTTYSVRGEELFEVVCPCSGLAQGAFGRGSGRLELGRHPVADAIRDLEPGPDALFTRSYLNLRILIPPPRVIGTARPYSGYVGTDREAGTYTIRYPDGATADLAAIADRRRGGAAAG